MDKKLTVDLMSRKEDITIEEVRTFNSYKDWTDERILELINTLKILSQIMYNNWSKRPENGKIIAMNIDNQTKIAA